MVSVSDADRQRVLRRANGKCERCGRVIIGTHSIHHRQPRGMGGTRLPRTNGLSNLMLLCGSGVTGCHGQVERHRSESYEKGWLVRHGMDPAEQPVLLWWGWATLDDRGDSHRVEEAEDGRRAGSGGWAERG